MNLINIYSSDNTHVSLGMGENFLALEGMALDLPATTINQQHAATTFWDDCFEEDIAALKRDHPK